MAPNVPDILRAVVAGDEFPLGSVTPETWSELRDEVRSEPLEAELFAWLCSRSERALAHPLAIDLLGGIEDVGVMAEATRWISRSGGPQPGLRRALWDTLTERARHRGIHDVTRGFALYGATCLAQSDRGLLRRLQADLIDLSMQEPGRYLRHAAKVIGALLAHDPDDDMRSKLRSIAEVPDARDEAAMELGLDLLRTGLDQRSRTSALASFREARAWFDVAWTDGDERIDADLYRNCLAVVLAFQDEDASVDLGVQVEVIRRVSFDYVSYLSRPEHDDAATSWLGFPLRERIHWSTLGLKLSALDTKLRRTAWLNAAAVIEQELVAVYTASRSIFLRDESGGLESVLRPRISGSLQQDRVQLEYLDAWVTENAGSPLLPDALAMRAEVERALAESLHRDPEKATAGAPTVVAALRAGRVPQDVQEDVVAHIRAKALTRGIEGNVVVTDVLRRVVAGVSQNPYYVRHDEVRGMVEIVSLVLVGYVASRHEVAKSTLPAVAYLFEQDRSVLERELQMDLHQFLVASAIASWCQVEVRDLGGGRADILLTSGGVRLVIELKRTDRDLSQEGLVEAFGLQAVSYQTVGPTVAFLTVLDLFDRQGGQQHLTEQVTVHRKRPDWGNTDYDVVVLRVQGRRKAPSDLNP